jgi:taurine-pyruvate aminotransferase
MGGAYYAFFVNSGSEANEAGFKIARQYMKQEHPGEYRFKTIGRYFGYHGTTLATWMPAAWANAKRSSNRFRATLCMSRRPIARRWPR